jgi:hypothetical protein
MKNWIDPSERRTGTPRADQLPSRFPLAVNTTRRLGCPDFASGATQPPAVLQPCSIASLRGRQPGKKSARQKIEQTKLSERLEN